MKRQYLYALAAFFLCATPAAAQFTVTAPSGGANNVKAANDFATKAFQDPWDMSQRTDVGWWLFGTDAPASSWSNPAFSGGVFSATTAAPGARLFLLESGLQEPVGDPASPIGKTGKNYPIDATRYTHLLYRMSSPAGFQDTGDGGYVSQFVWSAKTMYDDQTLGASKEVIKDFAIYDVDLTTLPRFQQLGPNTPWGGTMRALQFLPVAGKANVATQLDWVRLVQNDPALYRTITWTGGAAADIYLDNDQNAANGTLGRIAINTRAGNLSFFVGGLEPGDYYVAVALHNNSAQTTGLAYSTGFYRVNAIPMLTFTTPNDEGSSDDFATAKLGNPWDFTSLTDIDFKSNITNDAITQLPLVNEAGTSLGTQTVYLGTNLPGTAQSGGVGDPFLFPLFWNGRGKQVQIDPRRYRILTVDMGIPNLARSLPGGSIGRVVWRAVNEPRVGSDGLPAQTVSQAWVFNHKLGENTMSHVTVDLKNLPVEPGSPGQTAWLNASSVEAFRFDPHEFSEPVPFFMRQIKIAALERTSNNQFTFRWATTKPTATVSLYVDSDTSRSFNMSTSTLIAVGIPASAGNYLWTVPGNVGDGEYQIWASTDDGVNTNQVYAATPIVVDRNNTTAAQIVLNRTQLNFATFGPTRTAAQTIRLTFTGSGSQCWTASSNLQNLFTITPSSGTGAANISIAASGNFPSGATTSAIITIQSCGNPLNSATIAVAVTGYAATGAPVGSFDSPADGSTASGSVAVTGWAADDIEVTGVAICRDGVAGEATPAEGRCGGQPKIFIDPATFIDDARTDITTALPNSPFNYRAGWGYLMLTNFLPNNGNGVVQLYAYASDREGHFTLLGTKTITTANNAAFKPFGAIDTPKQGEVVCGSSYVNFGWTLTQKPKFVLPDSSTIQVFIDNVAVGRPGPRGPRSDISAVFPSSAYDTSNPVGGFVFDTTQFPNGRHSIHWLVTDSSFQQDGIGSRFFTISNPCPGS